MKKKLILLLIAFGLFLPLSVQASGTATVGFDSPDSVAVGKTITVTMYVSNVAGTNNGVVSLGGNLSFDSTYLEYVSSKGSTSPYTFQMNQANNYKIAGLDTTLANGITGANKVTVFTFTFKALKIGATTVSLTNEKLTDTSSAVATTVAPKTITIRAQDTNANLASLSVTNHTITPSFNGNTTSYSLTVPYSTSAVSIQATPASSYARVTGTGNKSLSVGTNTATIRVTAESGATKDYTIIITREKDTNNTLSSLRVGSYSLSPAFSGAVTSYRVSVPYEVDKVVVSATASSSNATVTGTGEKTLNVGANPVTVTVRSASGENKEYQITITREERIPNHDSSLKTLEVTGQTLLPTFQKEILEYNLTVKHEVTSLDVTATPNDPLATANIAGNTDLQVGSNTIKVTVTAEDGTTTDYLIHVTRQEAVNDPNQLSANNYLAKLKINNSYAGSYVFYKNTLHYSITVPSNIMHLSLNPVPEDEKAIVRIYGNSNFQEGSNNLVTIEVTAEDGSTRDYVINVTKSPLDSNVQLDYLEVLNKALENFNPNILEYKIVVDHKNDYLDINAGSDGASVEIIGNQNLQPGENTIIVKVTDANGFAKYYELQVTREEARDLGIYFIGGGILLFVILLVIFLTRHGSGHGPTQTIDFKPNIIIGPTPSSTASSPVSEDILKEIEEATKDKDLKRIELLLEKERLNEQIVKLKNQKKELQTEEKSASKETAKSSKKTTSKPAAVKATPKKTTTKTKEGR